MKTNMRWLAIPAALAMAFSTVSVVRGESLNGGFGQKTYSGTVTGVQSNCDQLSATPHAVTLTKNFSNLRFTLESAGQPILKITGPGGLNECIMTPGNVLEAPGFWTQGNYSISIGARQPGSHSYTLKIIE